MKWLLAKEENKKLGNVGLSKFILEDGMIFNNFIIAVANSYSYSYNYFHAERPSSHFNYKVSHVEN